MFDSYYQDDIDAVNAKFEAQKIAFAPLSFQAARALRDFGILELVSKSRRKGITVKEISEKTGLSEYGVGVLMEMGLGMGMLKLKKDSPEDNLLYTLSKVGFFVMTDDMTRVNMDFSEDVCYAGADDLAESIKNGKPEGLQGGAVVDAWNDHRIAMSMAVATLACKEPVTLTGGESVSKSYPEFWNDYAAVGGKTEKIN